jgi:hypothetical protein
MKTKMIFLKKKNQETISACQPVYEGIFPAIEFLADLLGNPIGIGIMLTAGSLCLLVHSLHIL